jgi:oxepin-CoA hydrolase/3-oxo-5,6-dehydrosuberyl-CoA semialdehyde dehydrogenase
VVVIENIITISVVSVEAGTHHGRVRVLDRDDAKESTGHGSLTPTLLHGGPGRAGGSEELGGIRGVLQYMQRSAIQASPDVLTAITGRWTSGAARHQTKVYPFRQHLEELQIADTTVGDPDTADYGKVRGDAVVTNQDAAVATYGVPTLVAKLPAQSNARES